MDSPSKPSNSVRPAPLPRSVVVRYAAGSLGTGGFATLPGLVLVYYLTDSLGVTALAAGAIVTLAKVWDVLIDPVIGGLSDRVAAKHGSRRGPMLLGTVGLPVAFVLMFSVPAQATPGIAAVWVLIAFIAAATFFSLFQVPYVALPAELTDGYDERTRLLTWRVVVLTIAILLFGAGGPELRALFPEDPLRGYLVMAIGAALVLALGLGIATTTAAHAPVRTVPTAPARTSRPATRAFSLSYYRAGLAVLRESQPFRVLLATFMLQGLATGIMLAGAQFVARWVLLDESAVTILFAALIAPALIVAPAWGKLSDRIGKERSFKIASGLFLVATLLLTPMLIVPGWWIVGPVALAGAAYAGMQTLPMAMLPDVISHDADHGGRISASERTSARPDSRAAVVSANDAEDTDSAGGSRAGVFGGVWTAGETAGMALGATVLTLVLALAGYVESRAGVTVEQPAAAVAAISLCFSAVPAVIMFVSLRTLNRYPLGARDIEASRENDSR